MNLLILASCGGSNAESILKNIKEGRVNAQVKVIITNDPNAGVYDKANNYDIPIECINSNPKRFNKALFESADQQILKTLQDYDVNLVILAGYLKMISKELLDSFHNRILNIHPSLLPKYGGPKMHGHHVHEAVIASNDTESGATIHIIDEKYDEGHTLSQYKVPRYKDDTPDTLAARVLKIEHVAFPQTLKDILDGYIDLDNPPKQFLRK